MTQLGAKSKAVCKKMPKWVFGGCQMNQNLPPRLPDGKKRRLLINAGILLVVGIFLAGRFTLAGDWNAATIAVEAMIAAVIVFQVVLYIKIK
jgi:hypothetical protein